MTDMKAYGFPSGESAPSGLLPARITEVRRKQFGAVCPEGEVWAILTGAFLHRAGEPDDYPAVGDFVYLRHNPHGPSGIVRLLPRRTKFSRADFSGHAAGYAKTIVEQVVAANFDTVLILSSLNQDFNIKRIGRYLTQANAGGGVPVVVLTKADLCADPSEAVAAVQSLAPGVATAVVSSQTGQGMEALSAFLLPGQTAVLLGMSGVGKSSLLNALAGETRMAVSEIREDDARGRHTTTHRQLFLLPSGALIIDTPGLRELGLWGASESVSEAFQALEGLAASCRFSDCRHKTEPGCAVIRALADGTLNLRDWERYLSQKAEADFVSRRTRPPRKGKRR